MPARSIILTALVVLLLGTLRAADDEQYFTPTQKDHWAWRPPVRPDVPAVAGQSWVRNPIDAFVLSRLEAAGLEPTPPASRELLLRRVTLDLTGLPPTPGEIDGFLADRSPDAWERVVDRLLASPRYGERWGRHWLDVARYADSNGYEHDEVRPDAWRYRDYVIRSFNADKPYDRFVQEQIAGDELFPGDLDAMIATGFNLMGPDMTDSADQAQRRQNTLDDMTDTAALVFLGLTVGCARCHDHKFEPILQADFYRLQAFFAPAAFRHDLPVASAEQRTAHAAALRQYEQRVKPIRDSIAHLEEPYRRKLYAERLAKLSEEAREAHQTTAEKRTTVQRELVEKTTRFLVVTPMALAQALSEADRAKHRALQEQLKKFDGNRPTPLPAAMGLADQSGPTPRTFVLERGERNNPAEEVQPGFLVIMTPGHQTIPAPIGPASQDSTGRRATLARWVVGPNNPLTARVLVNRLWQHHFGRGIVATPSDFGVRGRQPTHAELLDWLAVEFVQSGWSMKHMHRLILTSATYRQSAISNLKSEMQKDPENLLFSRMPRRRLEGEVIRDSLLAVSGRLVQRMGGPGVVTKPPGDAPRGPKDPVVTRDPQELARRSIYLFARRNLRVPFLEAFDLPDSTLSCPKRERSTTAPQALALLNSADVTEASKALAARLRLEARDDGAQIERAYRLALGRSPSAKERDLATAFLAESPLEELCRALLNLNEFVYTE